MKPSVYQVVDRVEELGDEDYRGRESFEDYSKFYEGEDKLKWIWRKGVNLGKKMVITGVVVSSAPFVLPQIVIMSAIGFALSVPAALVFATYACTDKLMNTLLPMPAQPLRLGSGTMSSSDEDEGRANSDEVDEGYEEDDEDRIVLADEDTRKEIENRIELAADDYGDVSYDHSTIPRHRDEGDTRMSGTEIVEESGYEEDVGDVVDLEEQSLDSSVIPVIMEGIREADDDISKMESEGIELPKDSLSALVVEAEVGGRSENDVEQVTEELVFVPPREENMSDGDLADVDESELRNETTALLEQLRDEGRDDRRNKDSQRKGKRQENEPDVGIAKKSTPEESGDKKLPVIPEEVKPSGIVGSEGLNESHTETSEMRNENRVGDEQSELVIERMLVVNVKTSGDRSTTDSDEGTSSDGKLGTLIVSEVAAIEVADESGFDQSTDSLNKGEDFASESSFDVSVDYHEVRIDSIPPMSRHAETDSDKEFVNEENIWRQIHAVRTIIGYKTAPHASCVDELEALYEFTGVEPPISSKDAPDLADVNEMLHSLMSVIGVK